MIPRYLSDVIKLFFYFFYFKWGIACSRNYKLSIWNSNFYGHHLKCCHMAGAFTHFSLTCVIFKMWPEKHCVSTWFIRTTWFYDIAAKHFPSWYQNVLVYGIKIPQRNYISVQTLHVFKLLHVSWLPLVCPLLTEGIVRAVSAWPRRGSWLGE